MLKIGDFSKMGKTTVKTLRYYDSIGLLRPKQIDEETGYRWYSTEQLIALARDSAMAAAGTWRGADPQDSAWRSE